MTLDQILPCLPLLAQLAMLAERWIRVVTYRRRGIRVLAHHRVSVADHLFDLANLLVNLSWLYMLTCEAFQHLPAWLPDRLTTIHLESLPTRLFGALLVIAGPILYELALRQMGESWRLGVDRQRPGPLVTTGLFALMRNPIYVAFDLLFLGTLLVTGRTIFMLLGGVLILFMHARILREERFLTHRYGEDFLAYKSRVRRYGVL